MYHEKEFGGDDEEIGVENRETELAEEEGEVRFLRVKRGRRQRN